jgi:ribosome biogenesis GTPase
MSSSSLRALVLRIDAKVCHVEIDGERRQVPLAGKLFEGSSREKQPLAVGDLVELEPSGNAIAAALPRTSQLQRRAAGEGSDRAQVLAANLTLALATSSAAEPPFQSELVDGVVAAAKREEIEATVVVTKADLDPTAAAEWRRIYERAGVRTFVTSLVDGHRTADELAALADLLHRNRTVICGVSGAGKSSLLNELIPGLDLRVGSLNHIRQGRHTTTHTELIPLPGGGHVLDTPGVRNFHLFHCGSQELQFLFPELAELLPKCAFRSCLHRQERDCAVLAAVAAGAIAKSRYTSYQRMLEQALAEERPGSQQAVSQRGARRRPRS